MPSTLRPCCLPLQLLTALVPALACLLLACAHAHARQPTLERPESVLQTDHTAEFSAITFSRDGRLLVTGSMDNTVKLWDVTTGRQLRTFADATSTKSGTAAAGVSSVALSPDGRLLASSHSDVRVQLWDIKTGERLRLFEGAGGAIAFTPDGRWLTMYRGADFTRWDLLKERESAGPSNLASGEWVFAFSPDGRVIASSDAGFDAKVSIWSTASGRRLRTLNGSNAPVAFSPDGRWLATGFVGDQADDAEDWVPAESTIMIWDTRTWELAFILSGHSHIVTSLSFSPDGRWLASSCKDRMVKVWDMTRRALAGTFVGHEGEVQAVVFHPDGKRVASASSDRRIRLWDVSSGRAERVLGGGVSQVRWIRFSPDGRFLLTVNEAGADLWDIATNRGKYRLSGYGGDADFSPDGLLVAYQTDRQTVQIWNTSLGRAVRTFAGGLPEIDIVRFSPDGRLLRLTQVLGGGGRRENWFEMAAGKRVAAPAASVAEAPADDNAALPRLNNMRSATSPDGRLVAAARYYAEGDNDITLWDVGAGKELRRLVGHKGEVTSMDFSPDGRVLASCGADRMLRLWDVGSGRALSTLEGHTSAVASVDFSPDGRLLATGGADGAVIVWDASSGARRATLLSLNDGRDWLVAAPDGRFDGSHAGWNKFLWRFSQNTFDVLPAESFFNEFFQPGLLPGLTAGARPGTPRDIQNLDRRQPVLRLSAPAVRTPAAVALEARTVRVRVEASEAPAGGKYVKGSGVRDVRLFRNGSLVKVWRGDLQADAEGKVTLEEDVTLVAGENRITAYAFNRDNIRSEEASLLTRGAERLRRRGTAYVLAVGVNLYRDPSYNLKYAVPDALAFGEEVERQQGQPGALFASVERLTLTDAEATRENLLAMLRKLGGEEPRAEGASASLAEELRRLKKAEPEDAVFIYFSGHGKSGADGRFYLVTHEAVGGAGGAPADAWLNQTLARSVSDADLELAFEKIDSGRLLLVIDACDSGRALEADEPRRGPLNTKGLAQLAYEKGMYVLTASQSYQAAWEMSELGHGLLTYVLVEEGLKLRKAVRSGPGDSLPVRDWLDYAVARVPQIVVGNITQCKDPVRVCAVSYQPGESANGAERGGLQRPQLFYRREDDGRPWVIGPSPGN